VKRVRTKIGDVFCVRLDERTKGYFQYVAIDRSQLDSPVIKAFKRRYPIDTDPDLSEVLADDVDFYAHVELPWGVKMGLWVKVGHVNDVGDIDVLFRGTSDYGVAEGEEPVRVSRNWRVWRLNEVFQYVGTLKGKNRKAEIGVVVAPPDIVERMQTGEYDFVYPDYE
jgi:hypothetical protein